MPTKYQCTNQLDPGRRLELIGDENTKQRRAATACTRTRRSRGRGAKTDRRIENAGEARATGNKHNNQTHHKQMQCALGLTGRRRRPRGACLTRRTNLGLQSRRPSSPGLELARAFVRSAAITRPPPWWMGSRWTG